MDALTGQNPEDGVGDEARADAGRDAVGEGHTHHGQQGRKALDHLLLAVQHAELADDRRHVRDEHEEPDHDEGRSRRLGRNDARERREEHSQQEHDRGHDGSEAGASTLGDASRRLDVGGVRGGRSRTTKDRAEAVDDQDALEIARRVLPVLVEETRLLADAGHGAHGVEEVEDHDREDHGHGTHGANLGEHAEVEALPEGREVWRTDNRVRNHRHTRHAGVGGVTRQGVHDHCEERRDDDADQEPAAHVQRDEDRHQHQADQEDHEGGCRDSPDGERSGRNAGHLDESAIHESDQRDEKADADGDRLLQMLGDSLHHGLAHAAQDEQQNHDAAEEDDAHRLLPQETSPRDEPEGHRGVDSHARGEQEGVVSEPPHQEGQHGGRETGHREGRRESRTLTFQTRDTSEREDRWVDEDDVAGDGGRSQTAHDLTSNRRPATADFEPPLQPGLILD